MELVQLLLTGSLAGLASVLVHSAAWSALALMRGGNDVPRAEPTTTEALLHMVCGILLALLFWLSWGLAAVIEPRWWMRGVIFGALSWLALAVPSIASLALARALDARSATLVAMRWGTTALCVGLACAWSWHQAV